MISGSLEEQAAYETLIASFEKDNPNVDVVLNNFPEESFNEKLATMFSAGAPPPYIFLMNFRNLGVFAANGALYTQWHIAMSAAKYQQPGHLLGVNLAKLSFEALT